MSKSRVTFSEAQSLSRPQVILDEKTGLPKKPEVVEAKKSSIRVQNKVPKLKFKYVKNRLITLREVATPIIPSRAIEVVTNKGVTTVHDFDLNVIHEVQLRDENPRIPTKIPGMSDTMYDKLINQAEETAVSNRLWNDMIRYELASYVEKGTLEIVDDPYDGREVNESDYESAVKVHRPEPKN